MSRMNWYMVFSWCVLWLGACVSQGEVLEGYESFERGGMPKVRIDEVADVTKRSVVLVVTLADDGGRKIERVKVCLSENCEEPDTTMQVYDYAVGLKQPGDSVHILLDSLDFLTKYYCRLYVSNRDSSSYSESVNFKTDRNRELQNPITLSVEVCPYSMAFVHWMVYQDDQEVNTDIQEMGVVYADHQEPTIEDGMEVIYGGYEMKEYCHYIYGLEPGRTYYCRACIKNSHGVAYGKMLSFRMPEEAIAALEDLQIEGVYSGSTELSFVLNHTGGLDGKVYGICWSKSPGVTVDDRKEEYRLSVADRLMKDLRCTVDGLEAGKAYYMRGFVKNDAGVGYTEEQKVYIPGDGQGLPKSWGLMTKHPSLDPSEEAALFRVKNDLYSLFSFTSNPGEYGAEFWEYNMINDEWEQLPDFPGKGREESVVVATDLKIYVLGGYSKEWEYRSDFWEYDISSRNWMRKQDFLIPFSGRGVGFEWGGKVYVGGFVDTGGRLYNNRFWCYDPENDHWSDIAPIPGPFRCDMAVGVVDGRIFVYGGSAHFFRDLNELWEYLPADDLWMQRATCPGRSIHSPVAFTHNGLWYVGGGVYYYDANNSMDSRQLWAYDPVGDKWERKRNLSVGGKARVAVDLDGGFLQSMGNIWRYIPDHDFSISEIMGQ